MHVVYNLQYLLAFHLKLSENIKTTKYTAKLLVQITSVCTTWKGANEQWHAKTIIVTSILGAIE